MPSEVSAKKHEIFGVVLFFIAVLLLLCLISYDPGDPSVDVVSMDQSVSNSVGKWGARVSDVLYQIFGFSAFYLPIPLIVLAWKLVFGRKIQAPYFRATGLFLLIAGTSTALQLLPIKITETSFEPGGVIGSLLHGLLVPNLNTTGTIVIVLAALILGLLASTTLSLGGIWGYFTAKSGPPGWRVWEYFRKRRENRKPARAVVNIKPPAAPSMDLTPRPAPVKIVPPASTNPMNAETSEGEPPEPQRHPFPAQERPRTRKFILPPIELLDPPENGFPISKEDLMEKAAMLTAKCAEFGVIGNVTQIHPGPVVTTFEFKPDAGIKYSRITSLVDDLCLGIKAESLRIDRIPGKATVGIEVPNKEREIIMLRELLESDSYRKSSSKLTLALGKLINGSPYMTDLKRMPHLLIAGATGSGKSVSINCMITSILYKSTPDEVRFIFIDPKRLELGLYADIPHLLTPIVTDPGEAGSALRWATNEMDTRYRKLARRGVRDIDQYNRLVRSSGSQLSLLDDDQQEEYEQPLPYIVLVIDEFADLMMISSKEVETSIARLAAMARAVGIHLILATQRPSVDIITGIIKGNLPCRIAFKVASKVDSRTIMESNGAEQLLGNGDMLFIPPGSSRLTRIHGAFMSETEAQAIAENLRKQGTPAYDESVLSFGQEEMDEAGNPIDPGQQDSLYNEAVNVVITEGRASTSLLQRRLSIGYGRAAKLIDMMFYNGIVGPADGSKPREILVGTDFLERFNSE